jgi:hypothetical protein
LSFVTSGNDGALPSTSAQRPLQAGGQRFVVATETEQSRQPIQIRRNAHAAMTEHCPPPTPKANYNLNDNASWLPPKPNNPADQFKSGATRMRQ